MGRNFARMRGLQFVALRFAQIYGPGKLQRHGPYGLFSQLVESPLAGKPVKVPRGGEQRDDVIYVDDIAEAIVLALLHQKPAYDAYNISRGIGTTLHDFADAVRKVVPGAKIEIGPGLDYHGLGASYCGIMDNTRARTDLGFEPKFDLVRGVAHYVETMRQLGLDPVTA
jgi:UDP-glucose 4-epimerase